MVKEYVSEVKLELNQQWVILIYMFLIEAFIITTFEPK